MATIYDIAELSKTSAATVSYVLNGRGDERRISKATQERILAVAERLNYHPNITARQLKTTGKPMIHIAALWPEFYFDQPLISAMHAIRDFVKYSTDETTISVHFFAPDRLKDMWQGFQPENYNAIILSGASMADLEFISRQRRTVPIVLFNRRLEGFPSACIDHGAAGQIACDMLCSYPGEPFCSIWDTRFHVATNLRKTMFEHCCQEKGISHLNTPYTCEGSQESGYELGQSLVRQGNLKRLIYCNNESIAVGVLTALNEAGIRVGRDVLMITANNGPDTLCRFQSPPLTTIHLRLREVFGTALRLAVSAINRNDQGENEVVLQPMCLYRGSFPEEPIRDF